MLTHQISLLAAILSAGNVLAEGGATESVRARIQAEQVQKQSRADAFRRYLGAEPSRMRQLDESASRLQDLALRDSDSGPLPAPNFSPWQEAITALRTLSLPPAASEGVTALSASLKDAARLLSALPAGSAGISPEALMKRRQTLMAGATALLEVKQQAARLDEQLEQEVRQLDAAKGILSAQSLLLPAAKGEKR